MVQDVRFVFKQKRKWAGYDTRLSDDRWAGHAARLSADEWAGHAAGLSDGEWAGHAARLSDDEWAGHAARLSDDRWAGHAARLSDDEWAGHAARLSDDRWAGHTARLSDDRWAQRVASDNHDRTKNPDVGTRYDGKMIWFSCLVKSSAKVGVVSGTDFTWIGEGNSQGAIYDWVPGRSTLGTDIVVYLTPGREQLGDLLQVMAISDYTHILISTDFHRFVLHSGKSIIRKFTKNLVQVQSDHPVVVVKFSQSGGIQGITGHPTMTYIPPTDLYVAYHEYVIPEILGYNSMTQVVVVVGTRQAVECVAVSLGVQTSTLSLYGK
ncbi:signal recognition particle receptor FtsY [Elysia marginata]|uniref:Signal recognition particle receptor FtsY n=1 Tax=Elysia marginata TaxID=1093978 RepID=A0AAV4F061_9GAST|nr:signal recognition particle receptor FtsY [Elysia marginata]